MHEHARQGIVHFGTQNVHLQNEICNKKTVSVHNLERVSVRLSAALCAPAAEISSVQWWSWS
jgi:hypothetical protein